MTFQCILGVLMSLHRYMTKNFVSVKQSTNMTETEMTQKTQMTHFLLTSNVWLNLELNMIVSYKRSSLSLIYGKQTPISGDELIHLVT